METIDVVLPCLDEAAALPEVLGTLPEGYRAIVVDNGSSDGSPKIAADLGAKVIHEPRKGYGAAVHTGLEHATSELVCFMDADASLDPAELPKLVAAADSADLAVGKRVPADRGVWPWHARAGNTLLAAMLRYRGLKVTDIAPMRVGYRSKLLELGITDRAFGYPLELLIRANKSNWKVVELPVTYRARAAGTKSKVSGSVKGTLRAVRDMAGVLR